MENKIRIQKIISTMDKEDALKELSYLEIKVLHRLVELSRNKKAVEGIKDDFKFNLLKKII